MGARERERMGVTGDAHILESVREGVREREREREG